MRRQTLSSWHPGGTACLRGRVVAISFPVRGIIMPHTLTSTEVAAFAEIEEARIRKDVEYGVVGAGSPPRFDESALVYFRTLSLIAIELGREDRGKLYQLIHDKVSPRREPPETLRFGPVLALQVGDLVRDLRSRLADFSAWKDKLVTDDEILGGETVFPRSRLSVRHIGELLEKQGALEEIREDYPHLTKRDLDYARLYARAYPRRGRPPEHREAAP